MIKHSQATIDNEIAKQTEHNKVGETDAELVKVTVDFYVKQNFRTVGTSPNYMLTSYELNAGIKQLAVEAQKQENIFTLPYSLPHTETELDTLVTSCYK